MHFFCQKNKKSPKIPPPIFLEKTAVCTAEKSNHLPPKGSRPFICVRWRKDGSNPLLGVGYNTRRVKVPNTWYYYHTINTVAFLRCAWFYPHAESEGLIELRIFSKQSPIDVLSSYLCIIQVFVLCVEAITQSPIKKKIIWQ